MDRLKEKKFISAVVYVHNQEGNIADFIKNLIEILENHFEHSEIVCVLLCIEKCWRDMI